MEKVILAVAIVIGGGIVLYAEHEVVWAFAGLAWHAVSAIGGPFAPLGLLGIALLVVVATVDGVKELLRDISR